MQLNIEMKSIIFALQPHLNKNYLKSFVEY